MVKSTVCTHQGPAHLSVGQEAAAVGEAYLLTVDDHILGSHRSHGEILAKGLAAIHQLPDAELTRTMTQYLGGDTLRVVEREPARDTKDLALNYLDYGLLAEILGRATGFNRGLGGSMHPQPGWLLDAIHAHHAHLVRLPGYRPGLDNAAAARRQQERGGV